MRRPCVRTDRVNRRFRAPRPNVLWVSGFTYGATWAGFVHVAFVIDAFARRIVGWRVSRTAHAGFVLDALEQALHERRSVRGGGLVHHSDRGVQYVSIKYTERLPRRASSPRSAASATATTMPRRDHQVYKAEVIHRRGPWRSFEAVEFATLEWVDWFNNRRLLEPIGNLPPAEAEAAYYAQLELTVSPRKTQTKLPPGKPGAVHLLCLWSPPGGPAPSFTRCPRRYSAGLKRPGLVVTVVPKVPI
jgi:putative transposase